MREILEHFQDIQNPETKISEEELKNYIPFINGVVGRLVLNRSLAEDLTQETLVRAIKALQDERIEIKDLKSYLGKVAKNTVFEYFRNHKGKKEVGLDETAEIPDYGKSEDKIIQSILMKEGKVILEEFVKRLSKDRKMVFELSYFEGLPPKEIAKKMQVSEAAIKTMLWHIRQKLGREFGLSGVRINKDHKKGIAA